MMKFMNGPIFRTLFVWFLGGIGGLIFFQLGSPAPFMLGSMLICWVFGGTIKRARPLLVTPWVIRRVFVAGVAVVLGSYASPSTVSHLTSWWPSLLVLALLSLLMAWLSYFMLRARGYDDAVAWFSAQPAGLSEVVAMAGKYTEDEHIVALFHLVRVSSVFLLAPLIVWLGAADVSSVAMPAGQLHIWQVSWWHWPLYIFVAGAGFLAARLIRLPMPNLLGPMLLAAAIAGSGVVTFERPFEAICMIQVALGSSIGARMGQVDFSSMWRVVPDAYANAINMVAIALLGAAGLAYWLDEPMLKFFLAIAPGGVSELSLISVAIGFEVAFVTLHHLFRMFVVLLAMPIKRL